MTDHEEDSEPGLWNDEYGSMSSMSLTQAKRIAKAMLARAKDPGSPDFGMLTVPQRIAINKLLIR